MASPTRRNPVRYDHPRRTAWHIARVTAGPDAGVARLFQGVDTDGLRRPPHPPDADVDPLGLGEGIALRIRPGIHYGSDGGANALRRAISREAYLVGRVIAEVFERRAGPRGSGSPEGGNRRHGVVDPVAALRRARPARPGPALEHLGDDTPDEFLHQVLAEGRDFAGLARGLGRGDGRAAVAGVAHPWPDCCASQSAATSSRRSRNRCATPATAARPSPRPSPRAGRPHRGARAGDPARHR
jgi:hypothetical protein